MKQLLAVLSLLLLLGSYWLLREDVTSEESPAHGQEIESPVAFTATPKAQVASASPPDLQDPSEPVGARVEVSAQAEVGLDARTFELLVKVSLVQGRSRSEVAPKIHIAVGIGTRADFGRAPLVNAVTDELGEVLVSLPHSAAEALEGDSEAAIWAQIVEPDFQQMRALIWLSRFDIPNDKPAEIELLAQRGATISGRLLNLDGEQTAGKVTLYKMGEGGSIKRLSGTSASAAAGFAVQFVESGTYQLLASGSPFFGRRGSVSSPGNASLNLAIDLEQPLVDIEIQLQGCGIIRGHLKGADGKGVGGVDLQIVLASAFGPISLNGKTVSGFEMTGAGEVHATVLTDESGRFERLGLRSGHYFVSAHVQGQTGKMIQLTPDPVPSDGVPLQLWMDMSQLIVTVLKQDGTPAADVALPGAGYYNGFPSSWGQSSTLMVVPVIAEADGSDAYDLIRQGKVIGPGKLAFEFPEGGEFDVVLRPPGAAPIIRRIGLTPSSGRLDLSFTLPPAAPMGTLAVLAFDSTGKQIPDDVSVRVVDLSSGICLLEKRDFYHRGDNWPVTFEIPTGEYALEVHGLAAIDTYHGTVMSPRKTGAFRSLFSILADTETRVDAHLSAPALLELSLVGEVLESDKQAIGQDNQWMKGRENEYAPLAEITLRRPGSYPIPVVFTRFAMGGTSAAGTHQFSSLAIGTTEKSEALPAGIFLLEARMPGKRLASKQIELVPGETLKVALVFEGE